MINQRILTLLVALPLCLLLAIRASAAPDLKTIMQDPDWIGPPVEAAWWQLASDDYVFRAKQQGSVKRDLFRVDSSNPSMRRLAVAEQSLLDGPNPVYSRDRRHAVTLFEGALILRDLVSGERRRLFTGTSPVAAAHFENTGEAVYFRTGQTWWRAPLDGSSAVPLTDLRFDEAPWQPGESALEQDQLRLFSTLERERDWQEQRADQALERAAQASELGPAPWYLGKGKEIVSSSLSADGRWLLLVTQSDAPQGGERDHMPHYVARSGYVDVEDVRRLVGRDAPKPHSLWLLDLNSRAAKELDLTELSGRHIDPLKTLKERQRIDAYNRDNLRPVTVSGVEWHPESSSALIQVMAADFKDRWTLRLDAPDTQLQEIHRYTDNAWVSWDLNEFGWMPGSDNAWLQSEETGFSHLYMIPKGGRPTPLTRGEFEVRDISFTADGRYALMLSNMNHPTEWDLFRLPLDQSALQQLTYLKAVESYAAHPNGKKILLRHSASYIPTQAAVSLRCATSVLPPMVVTRSC